MGIERFILLFFKYLAVEKIPYFNSIWPLLFIYNDKIHFQENLILTYEKNDLIEVYQKIPSLNPNLKNFESFFQLKNIKLNAKNF